MNRQMWRRGEGDTVGKDDSSDILGGVPACNKDEDNKGLDESVSEDDASNVASIENEKILDDTNISPSEAVASKESNSSSDKEEVIKTPEDDLGGSQLQGEDEFRADNVIDARQFFHDKMYPEGAATNITDSNLSNSPTGCTGPITYNNQTYDYTSFVGENHEALDKTYSVKPEAWGDFKPFEPINKVENAQKRLLQDRIVLLMTLSPSEARSALCTLLNSLVEDKFAFRTSRTSYDLDIYRSDDKTLIHPRPTVTYVDLFNSPLIAEPLLQGEYVSELQVRLKAQNNHLVLVIGTELTEQSKESIHASSKLYTWSIAAEKGPVDSGTEFSFDDPFGASVGFIVAFFSGLEVAEVDNLVRLITEFYDTKPDKVVRESEENPKHRIKSNTKSIDETSVINERVNLWDLNPDKLIIGRNIFLGERPNEGVGYYYKDVLEEERIKALLLEKHSQFVHRKIDKLLQCYLTKENASTGFCVKFTDLLVTLERKGVYSLNAKNLHRLYAELV